ncbi:unnamed protein product [Meloidogyne enterolobii]|uniref:Uncharacterized protein n=1 Tax=Meloidogyne enterolobii TaxID=390850 RepID=A0ACB0ZX14_MELEN
MTNETKNLESIELMQRNEWEILLLFSGLGEENNKRIIKLYAALALFSIKILDSFNLKYQRLIFKI